MQYYTRHISSIAVEGDFFPAPGLETVSSTAVRPVTLDSLLDNNTLGFFGQQQFGWETEDMGAVEAARAIEPLCMLWCIPGMLENRWTHAFKLLKS